LCYWSDCLLFCAAFIQIVSYTFHYADRRLIEKYYQMWQNLLSIYGAMYLNRCIHINSVIANCCIQKLGYYGSGRSNVFLGIAYLYGTGGLKDNNVKS